MTTGNLPHSAAIGTLGFLALILAFKFVRFILKVIFGLVGLALILAALWWLFLAH